MPTKPAVRLRPGDRITLYGLDQTVTGTEMSGSGSIHLATDTNPGEQAWVLDYREPVQIREAS